MSEKAYTVSEVDRMRKAITDYGFPIGVSYYPVDRAKEVEERIRTYMVAGVDVADLEEALRDAYMEKARADAEVTGRAEDEHYIYTQHANGQLGARSKNPFAKIPYVDWDAVREMTWNRSALQPSTATQDLASRINAAKERNARP